MDDPHTEGLSNLLNKIDFKALMEKADSIFREDDRPEINSERLNMLKRNMIDIMEILYNKEKAGLPTIDGILTEMYSREDSYIELGGIPSSIADILDCLVARGFLEKTFSPHRTYSLRRKYRNFFDALYLNRLPAA
jgi:hypothetical protein